MRSDPSDFVDRVLSNDEPIVPSSGFADAVMDAVRREAVLPAAQFPWARVLTGVGVAAALWIAGASTLLTLSANAAPPGDGSMLVLVEAVAGLFAAGTCLVLTRGLTRA